ncbi:hypothetical protein EW146_g7479 [Bondarzewia mesenterica]|uniref:Uncharacterized protein n=1 Tax=Bondarzewia mesenterica TaxID=1095465 RepID=A0A4S4LKP3_9AGAM|nr:hypothetical protein EW146_g7479 [Bondarzewia mesenterica]
MSRLPQPSSSRLPAKSPSSQATSCLAPPLVSRLRSPSPTAFPSSRTSPSPSSPTPLSSRLRTKSTPKPATRKAAPDELPPGMPKATLSIREAIALKRSEAKKAMMANNAGQATLDGHDTGLQDVSPDFLAKTEHDLNMGRRSVQETIERARDTGSVNLCSRDLICLPSALFEIHLGMKPQKLALVPDEPHSPREVALQSNTNSWFEQQDLSVLKAWSNEIIELQPEISLFGSLKNVDVSWSFRLLSIVVSKALRTHYQLHNNRLTTLPDSFPDLTLLTSLDLSHNNITHFPSNFFALPALTTLNISHNALVSLPFNTPFTEVGAAVRSSSPSNDFFTPAIVRADRPLPRLTTFNASSNNLRASSVDHENLPQSLVIIDLSENPLTSGSGSSVGALISSLSVLPKVEELHLARADIDDTAFHSCVLPAADSFKKLRLLDLEETQTTRDAVSKAFSILSFRELDFSSLALQDGPPSRPPTFSSVIMVVTGKKIIRETWEIEADNRAKLRNMRSAGNLRAASTSQMEPTPSPMQPPPIPSLPSSSRIGQTKSALLSKREIAKDQWEIEAEQGLLTEGGRRRARALAAAAQQQSYLGSPSVIPSSTGSLLKDKYFDSRNQTLTLPPLAPPSRKVGHKHGFSLAAHSLSNGAEQQGADLSLPTATLPLSLIVSQPFADTLRVLELKGRRTDPSFILPGKNQNGSFLPRLEELYLEGCGLSNETQTVVGEDRKREDIVKVLARLFPSIKTLDLAYNSITESSLSAETLGILLLSAPEVGRAGVQHLRLRGNRIAKLDGFVGLAKELFGNGDGGRDKGRWALEELDVRDNAVEGLAGELGLLPLEVFLVEGNM